MALSSPPMLELLCPSCEVEDNSFTQYSAQPATLIIDSEGIITDYSLDTVEVEEETIISCGNCSWEGLLYSFREAAESYNMDEEDEEEEDEEDVTRTARSIPVMERPPRPHRPPTGWEQVRPIRESLS